MNALATNRHEAKLIARLGDWGLRLPAPRAPKHGERVILEVPVDVPSMANARMHFRAKAHLTKRQRYAVASRWTALGLPRGHRPASVHLVRIGVRDLDDDNLQGALKAHRDQVAECCWMDDRARIWTYAQERGAVVGVRIEVWWP